MSEKNIQKNKINAVNMKTYCHDIMPGEAREFAENGKIKTGFDNIDANGNIYPGLYVIGGASSLGKTTIIHQMCDQIAAAGNPTIYFSLEQSALELASKSVSRLMAITNPVEAMTSINVRRNMNDENVKKAIEIYDTFSSNVTIAECGFDATIEDIEAYVEEYVRINNTKPVVVVDYLQVIRASDSYASSRNAVDENIKRLKQLSKNNNLVVIVISSLNRQNYMNQIDFESFKESGGIEYTADVLWGLQLAVLSEPDYEEENRVNEKRKKVQEAKASPVRRIEFCCLKNRFGKIWDKCYFEYYSKYDYFKPEEKKDIDMRLT